MQFIQTIRSQNTTRKKCIHAYNFKTLYKEFVKPEKFCNIRSWITKRHVFSLQISLIIGSENFECLGKLCCTPNNGHKSPMKGNRFRKLICHRCPRKTTPVCFQKLDPVVCFLRLQWECFLRNPHCTLSHIITVN